MIQELKGRINPTTNQAIARLNQGDQSLIARLNVYTMETGDGREIELCVVEDAVCWRRVGDTQWKILFPLSDITPERGVDYFTEADIEYLKNNLGEIPLGDMIPEGTAAGTLLVVGASGGLTCSDVCVSDIADKTYIHKQVPASDTWVITHNLKKHPSVSVVDSAGNAVVGDVIYSSLDSLTIKFSGAFSGRCYLN